MARKRSASLQERHQRGCKSGKGWTKPGAVEAVCDCEKGFYVVYSDRHTNKQVREPVGSDPLEAQTKLLEKLKIIRDQGSVERPSAITLGQWCDEWLASRRKAGETSLIEYATSIRFIKAAVGADKLVRSITTSDVTRLATYVKSPPRPEGDARRPRQTSSTTQRKHLNLFNRLLSGAVMRGHLRQNPFSLMEKDELPSTASSEAPFFTDDELPVVTQAIPAGLYRTMFNVAVRTGIRQGELLSLTWGDVDLVGKTIHVRRSYAGKNARNGERIGVKSTKSKTSKRDVHITSDVAEILGVWWGESGNPGDELLVFPGGAKDGHVTAGALPKILQRSMESAGLPRDIGDGDRVWHSLRHTYARLAIENGMSLVALSKNLGHSSLAVTMNVYANHIEAAEKRAQADKLEGAFSF
jgi:integrase